MAVITGYNYFTRSLPLVLDFAISKGVLTAGNSVFITLESDAGAAGLGEAAPFPVLTGDNVDVVLMLCKGVLSELVGLSAEEALAVVRGSLREEVFLKSPTFLTGIEMALLDLIAKSKNLPMAALWAKASISGVYTDMTLPVVSSSTEVQGFWKTYSEYDFKEVKVKVGSAHLSDDVDRVVSLMEAAPHIERISLDGNQAFGVEGALKLLSQLKKNGIIPALFEQPLPKDDFAGMVNLTEKSPVPIFADETVVTVDDAKKVINEKGAHGINLKIMKSGIEQARQIGLLSKKAGLQVMIGGMLETEIAMTTSLHLVCGSGLTDWHDLDTPFFIKERVTDSSPYHSLNAFLKLPMSKGHGLELSKSLDLKEKKKVNEHQEEWQTTFFQ